MPEYSLEQSGTIVYTCVDNYRKERNMLTTRVCPVWSGWTFYGTGATPYVGKNQEGKTGMHSKHEIEPGNTT